VRRKNHELDSLLHWRQVLDGGKFGYALDKGSCVQLGTHGSLMKAEEKSIALGGPKFYSPGVCPAQFK
jgi:hypothetical protein